MLLVLETLTPTERAVFVLREVFDLDYDEIAEAVDKSPAAVRQIAHRARAHVAARRPRGTVSPAETRGALEAFQRAVETGDLQTLLDMLAPDVVLVGDGGGVKQASCGPSWARTRWLACWPPAGRRREGRWSRCRSMAARRWSSGSRGDRRGGGGTRRRRVDHRAYDVRNPEKLSRVSGRPR